MEPYNPWALCQQQSQLRCDRYMQYCVRLFHFASTPVFDLAAATTL